MQKKVARDPHAVSLDQDLSVSPYRFPDINQILRHKGISVKIRIFGVFIANGKLVPYGTACHYHN